jgi:hypothetical protein
MMQDVRPLSALTSLSMNSVVESSKLESRKDRKPNSGWKNVFKTNRARAVAKKKRLMKEALYRNMGGSVRELRRKMKEIRQI